MWRAIHAMQGRELMPDGTQSDVPIIVDWCMDGRINIDDLVTP